MIDVASNALPIFWSALDDKKQFLKSQATTNVSRYDKGNKSL